MPASGVTGYSDAGLLGRGTATLLASWERYAQGAEGASLQRLPGVTAAVFPDEPERSIYNNAVLEQGLSARARSCDRDGDCGIYNVGTLEHARRRGLATALTAIQLHDARVRGCETASLQSTPMAERLYATAGFRDLGRILEYVPPC